MNHWLHRYRNSKLKFRFYDYGTTIDGSVSIEFLTELLFAKDTVEIKGPIIGVKGFSLFHNEEEVYRAIVHPFDVQSHEVLKITFKKLLPEIAKSSYLENFCKMAKQSIIVT